MYHIKRFDLRIVRIIYGMLFCFLFIIARLFYLQITWSDHYVSRGKKNFLRVETTHSRRGNIKDRHGTLLATNRPKTILYWQGSGNSTLSEHQISMLQHMENIIGRVIIDDVQLYCRLRYAEKQYRRIQLADDISFEQLSRLQEQFPHDPNIMLETHFERHYPYHNEASHILGYLGRQLDDAHGQMGLEKLCETALKGEPGTILKTINSVGRDMAMVKLKESCCGRDIKTTLDFGIQHICENVFPTDFAGTIIVFDPEDGDILALVSRPTFDPTLFLKSLSSSCWQELQENRPFLNRALNAYPPGSIFKLITISAALEHNLVQPDQHWYCNGFVRFADRQYWCNNKLGHGKLDTTQAVAQSCNTIFYEIGKQIDIDTLAHYAHKFGLGSKTGFIFSEGVGLIPSREWKRRVRGERWWPGETLSAAIGQSFLLATPMQVARMIGSIFTGYLARPRILLDEEKEEIPLCLNRKTIGVLKESMRYVVTHGTGRRVKTVKDMEIYAKTSTAQTVGLQYRDQGAAFLEHAWFVAYCVYKTYKPFIFLVLLENAGSSTMATSVAKEFLIDYKKLIQERQDVSAELTA